MKPQSNSAERNRYMKPITSLVKKTIRRNTVVLFASMVSIIGFGYFMIPATVWRMLVPQALAATFTVTNTSDAGAGSLRAALAAALSSPGADTINFNIPPNDPRHVYYINDGVAGTVTRSMIAVTASSDDTSIGDIDPDWPHSWYSIQTAGFVAGPLFSNPVTIDGLSQPGSVPNTNPSGALNSVLKIEVTNIATDGSCSRIFHIA